MLVTGILFGCGGTTFQKTATTVSASFESGSIGKVTKASDTEWELYLKDDNNNSALPATWRSWWYVKMENLVQDAATAITLKNSGWPFYYLPVYSYDQKAWQRFSEDEVTQNQNNELIVKKQFNAGTVWLARFYPYTFTDLEQYVQGLKGNPNVDIQIPGYSQNNKPIYLFKITDFSIPVTGKKRILIHARTHPAETPPSFLIEGLIDYLLSDGPEAAALLAGYEFSIFPMQNVDGVIIGNYRSTPKSENLEVLWNLDSTNPLNLRADVPQEVAIVQQHAKKLMTDGGPPVSIALNLHASNSEEDIRTFFYPHFGTTTLGYSPLEASLWEKQILLINTLASRCGADLLESPPADGGSGFTNSPFPESWWWTNFHEQVMAMTIEVTYGRAGFAPRWVELADVRNLGASLAVSIHDYFSLSAARSTMRKATQPVTPRNLRYPELYPPDATDELKQ